MNLWLYVLLSVISLFFIPFFLIGLYYFLESIRWYFFTSSLQKKQYQKYKEKVNWKNR